MGTFGFADSDVKSFLLSNRVFRVGTDQTGQFLDNEPDLRHAPLVISESGCNANTKTVSAPREKLQDTLVLDGRKRGMLNRGEVLCITVAVDQSTVKTSGNDQNLQFKIKWDC